MPWDTEPNCPNPKGIAPRSPGLRGTSYPGYGWKKINYPEGVAPFVRPEPRVPFNRRRAFEVHGGGVLQFPKALMNVTGGAGRLAPRPSASRARLPVPSPCATIVCDPR